MLLCHDIEFDAQTVCHKSQKEDGGDPFCFGQALPQEKGDEETSHARKETLDDDDFRGTFVADHFGAVVFKTPADAGAQHKNRTLIEGKGVPAFFLS